MNSHGDSLISLEYRYHKFQFAPPGEISSEVVRLASKHGTTMVVTERSQMCPFSRRVRRFYIRSREREETGTITPIRLYIN